MDEGPGQDDGGTRDKDGAAVKCCIASPTLDAGTASSGADTNFAAAAPVVSMAPGLSPRIPRRVSIDPGDVAARDDASADSGSGSRPGSPKPVLREGGRARSGTLMADETAWMQVAALKQQLEELEGNLHEAEGALAEAQDIAQHREEENAQYKAHLQEVLWEYIPKIRKVSEIPAVDFKASGAARGVDANGHRRGSAASVASSIGGERRPSDGSLDANDGIPPLRDFQCIEIVGEGSFGKVWVAICDSGEGTPSAAQRSRESMNGDRVAVKCLDLENSLQLADVLAVEQEIRALKVLSHPNIVRLVDVIHAPSTLYLIMSYLAGGSLQQYLLARGPLPTSELREAFSGVLSAVAYCHSRLFCHRDIKPENVLLGDRLEPVLVDFGLSCKIAPGQKLSKGCGTNGFMAPEMHSRTPYDPLATDMWSLGALFLELACGNGTVRFLRGATLQQAPSVLDQLFTTIAAGDLSEGIPAQGADRMAVLRALLAPNDRKRMSAPKLANHEYFSGTGASGASSPTSSRRLMRDRQSPGKSLASGESPGSPNDRKGARPRPSPKNGTALGPRRATFRRQNSRHSDTSGDEGTTDTSTSPALRQSPKGAAAPGIQARKRGSNGKLSESASNLAVGGLRRGDSLHVNTGCDEGDLTRRHSSASLVGDAQKEVRLPQL